MIAIAAATLDELTRLMLVVDAIVVDVLFVNVLVDGGLVDSRSAVADTLVVDMDALVVSVVADVCVAQPRFSCSQHHFFL
mmetsp:Transcript_125405/g.313318  ORF Transcript_125405/g.313318 Transcript_125405/m.313318 type:complete len:80 (+) Transcript_125405:1306-1545(+)